MPQYFYRVTEHLTTFGLGNAGLDPYALNLSQPLTLTEEFIGASLHECRERAYAYFNQRAEALEKDGATFFLPFAAPKNFKHGENAAYFLNLILVEYHSADEQYEYILEGDDDENQTQNKLLELDALRDHA